MIRLKPFDKTTYEELRRTYLEKLVLSNAVEFDAVDILGYEPDKISTFRNETSDKTCDDLGNYFLGLKKYLFYNNGQVNRLNLRLLLAGPEPDDMPRSLGGNGKYDTMRQVFEEIIDTIKGEDDLNPKPEICKKIFKYNRMNVTNARMQENMAYWLQRQLNVSVCPFCNRMYTTTLYRNRVRPDFDHFYPQSLYPYFSVSLFNLIPICSVCNKAKSDNAEIYEDKDNYKKIIYPYDESFDEEEYGHASFCVIPNKEPIKVITGQSDDFCVQLLPRINSEEVAQGFADSVFCQSDLESRFTCGDNQHQSVYWDKIKSSISILKLEKIYSAHIFEIRALLGNYYQYSKDCIESRMKIFLRNDRPHATEQELMMQARNTLYFAKIEQDEWGKSPLNKLKADILTQLELLKEAGLGAEIHP